MPTDRILTGRCDTTLVGRVLAPAGVVGKVEDVLPRGGQVGADGEVFGVLEEALARRILAEPVGEARHGIEPAPVDGECAHTVEG